MSDDGTIVGYNKHGIPIRRTKAEIRNAIERKTRPVPGKHSLLAKMQRAIPGSDRDVCVYCGHLAFTGDHIDPQSKGGVNDLQNLAPACYRCNQLKGNTSLLLFIARRRPGRWGKWR